MRRLSLRKRMYGSTLLHKFFLKPPIFSSEEQKKKKVSTYFYSHYEPSPNLFATTRASMHPSSTVTITRRLSKHIEERDLPVPLSASKTLDRGAINLEGGASAPLAPPLNPPLMCSCDPVSYSSDYWLFSLQV